MNRGKQINLSLGNRIRAAHEEHLSQQTATHPLTFEQYVIDGASDETVTLTHDTRYPVINALMVELWFYPSGAAHSGGETLEVKLYSHGSVVQTQDITTPAAVSDGEVGYCSLSNLLPAKIHIIDQVSLSGDVTVGASETLDVRIIKTHSMSRVDDADTVFHLSSITDTGGVDDTAFSAGSDAGMRIMAANTDDEVDSGDIGVISMTTDRMMKIAGYNSTGDAVRSSEVNPLNEEVISEEVCDVTNADDSDGDNPYTYYIDMEGYSECGVDVELDGGSGTATLTVLGTRQDDGTAAASCTYNDVGSDMYGAASWTDDASLHDTNKIAGQFKYLKFVVTLDVSVSDDASFKLTTRKKY